MTFHTTRGITKVGKECCAALKRVGFPLPSLRGMRVTGYPTAEEEYP